MADDDRVADARLARGDRAALVEALIRARGEDLTKKVGSAVGLSPERAEALDREGQHHINSTKRRIHRCALWVVFYVSAALDAATAVGLVVGIGWIAYVYVDDVVSRGEAGDLQSCLGKSEHWR